MYRKKRRNKRSNAHDMMGIIFKLVVHALRLSGIKIPKNVLLPSQLPASVSSSEEEDMHGSEEEDAHDREEEHAHDREEDACGREQDHWNANKDEANQVHSDSRSPMLDAIDKLTEPTACSLLYGTGINVELALAKVFPFQTACHSVLVQDGYVVVEPTYVWANAGHYPLLVLIDGGEITTLAEALVQTIQWPKDRILIPPMKRHPNPKATTVAGVQHQMEVLQISVSKRRLNSSSSSSRSAKLHSKSVNNSRRRPGKLRLSSSFNMRISNRRNRSLSSSSRRSVGNLPLSSRCNMYSSLCNRRRIPSNLHCRRGTRPRNLCLKMRFLTELLE
jgi:hypothetical protein